MPTDAGGNNVYDVIVQVSDGSLTREQAIAVTVTAVNDNTPVITGVVTLSPIAEDSGPRLITQVELLVNASDVDGDTLLARS